MIKYTKTSPHFYLICKKCGSDEMYFKKIEKDDDTITDICICCDNCGELSGIDDYVKVCK